MRITFTMRTDIYSVRKKDEDLKKQFIPTSGFYRRVCPWIPVLCDLGTLLLIYLQPRTLPPQPPPRLPSSHPMPHFLVNAWIDQHVDDGRVTLISVKPLVHALAHAFHSPFLPSLPRNYLEMGFTGPESGGFYCSFPNTVF